jgi:hypothetical protein
MMSYLVPIMAATAAENRRRELMAEEERMSRYSQDDLDGDWEFKIVRANSPVFRKREALRKLLEEEALAGWTMVEKFDDSRIRLKRPRSARAKDAFLPDGVDPYRSLYGTSTLAYATIGLTLGLLIALALLLLLLVLA